MSFEGTGHGGAVECLKVPNGFFAAPLSTTPSKCEPGFEPARPDYSSCIKCEEGYFNPSRGGFCRQCPEYTYANFERTSCLIFDRIQTRSKYLYQPHLLQPD
jgi:hypothetical protein